MPLEALLQALTILPLDSIHSSSVRGNALYFDSEGIDSVARNCAEIHGRRKRKPPGHCRLLIADCRLKKWRGKFLRCQSAIENRQFQPTSGAPHNLRYRCPPVRLYISTARTTSATTT